MRFQWWPTLLLECDSNSANSCCYREKANFLKNVFIFANFNFSPVTFLPVVRKTNYIDTNNSPLQMVQ